MRSRATGPAAVATKAGGEAGKKDCGAYRAAFGRLMPPPKLQVNRAANTEARPLAFSRYPIDIRFGWAAFAFGSVRVRTPSSMLALILSRSMRSESENDLA